MKLFGWVKSNTFNKNVICLLNKKKRQIMTVIKIICIYNVLSSTISGYASHLTNMWKGMFMIILIGLLSVFKIT